MPLAHHLMAKMLLTKKGLDIVAVCDLDPNKVGKR